LFPNTKFLDIDHIYALTELILNRDPLPIIYLAVSEIEQINSLAQSLHQQLEKNSKLDSSVLNQTKVNTSSEIKDCSDLNSHIDEIHSLLKLIFQEKDENSILKTNTNLNSNAWNHYKPKESNNENSDFRQNKNSEKKNHKTNNVVNKRKRIFDFNDENSENYQNLNQEYSQKQLTLKDKELQNKILLISYNIFQQFDKIIDSFIKTAKLSSAPDVPQLVKLNENNKLILLLNGFKFLLNSYFKVDFPKSKYKKELISKLCQILNEVSTMFQNLMKEFKKNENLNLQQEMEYFDKIVKRKEDLEEIFSLKNLTDLDENHQITEEELNEKLSDFVGNFITGISLQENLIATINNSNEKTIEKQITEWKSRISQKLETFNYFFKVEEILPFFLEIMKKKKLHEYQDFLISLIGRIDANDYKKFLENLKISSKGSEEINLLFCDWIEEILNERQFLL